ncbi:hypothetical protein B2J88_35420 [Rhodococcus sp. SRB_17]|uniref:hypothetical protein n=1 Tax=Rhodococcus sp. OK302 TaxID=1882769 RepID=UPI000B941589|nr:hypothetical protein [Rhodococcus sp. OK302]NMM89572.1 hypothetical protein [Rhodococcus sp. SRB_17]OYD71055.1 hypothetical protein BDB13_4708 [Rhodococcus sp. OK302]
MTIHFEPSHHTDSMTISEQHELTVQRLTAEFCGLISAESIGIVVDGCVADLSWASNLALPELSERLARQRIIDYLDCKAKNFE